MTSQFWKCKDGRILRISDMTTGHLVNAVAFCKQRAEEIAQETEIAAGSFAGQDGAYFDGNDAAAIYLAHTVPFSSLCEELEYRRGKQ